jgi:PAS domain S-box-containing protein
MFGYTQDEALGQSLDLIIPKALRPLHWRGFNRAIETGRMKHSRAVLRVPATYRDGSIIAVRFTEETLVHGKDGTVDGVVVTVAGRDSAWVTLAYRLVLAALVIGERMWRLVRPARAEGH